MNSWGRDLPRDNSNNWPQHVNHHSRAGFGPASRRSGVDPGSFHPFSSSTPPPPVSLAPHTYHGENQQCPTLPYQHHAALPSIPQLQVGLSAPAGPPPHNFNKDHPPSCNLQLGQTSQPSHKYPPFHQSVDLPSSHRPGNRPPHRSHTGFVPQPHTNSALHWQSAEPSRFGQFYGKPPSNTPLPPCVARPKSIPATAQIGVSHPQSTLSPRPHDGLPPRMPFPIHKLPTRYTTPPPAVLPQSRPQFPSRHLGPPSHAHPVDIRPSSSHGEADLSVPLQFPGTQQMTQPPPGIVCTYPPPNFLPSSDDGHSQFPHCPNNSTSVCDPKQTFSVPPPTKPAEESSFWVRGDHLSNRRIQNFPAEPVDYQNDPSTITRSDFHGKDLSKPDKRRSRSPPRRAHVPTSRVRSPPRRSRSPSSHRSRSSSRRRSHSPSERGRPYHPHKNRDYSPSKKKSQSPVKRRPNTLYPRTSHTPSHGKSRSPSRKNSRTSSKVNTRSVERNNSTRPQTTYGTVKYENHSRTNSNSPCRGEDRSELFRFQAEFEQGVFKEEFPLVSLKKERSLPVLDLDKPKPIKKEEKPISLDVLECTGKEVGSPKYSPQHDKTRKDIEHDSNVTQYIESESNIIKNMECRSNSRKDVECRSGTRKDVEYRSNTRKDMQYRSSISKDTECKSNARKDATTNSDFKSIPSSTKRRDLSPAESLKSAKSTGSRSSVGVHPRHFRDNSISRSVSRESWRSSRSHDPRSGGSRSRPRSKERSSQGNKLDHASNNSVTEKEVLLQKYRQNYCATGEEIESKLSELSRMKPEEIIELEKRVWTRTAPADLYYSRDEKNPKVMRATPRLMELCERFQKDLSTRAEKVRAAQPKFELPPRKNRAKYVKAPNHHKSAAASSSDTDSNSESSTDEEDCTMEEMERKRLHPYRLHQELWFNDSGEMNDGPLCRCSARARKCGIRHGIYSGESSLMKCDLDTNNADKLYHYRITISPPTNFLTKTPTIIHYDEHEFIFEGFSMFSHFPLEKLPTCKVIRFNIEYMILYVEEKMPESFSIRQLDLFYDYIFHELLELVDLDFRAHDDKEGCPQFHFMPRFSRDLPDNGKEILSMNEVMRYLINNGGPLIDETKLAEFSNMPQFQWQNFADEIKGMVVTYPGMKPCSLRVDQLDRDQSKNDQQSYPEIVHFGIRPPQLSYAGNLDYQKAWRDYVKFRHLLANMPKPSFEDKRKLECKEIRLQEMRTQSKMKRDVTVAVSAKGFYRTGIMCDVVQHAMLIPVLVCHLRFHRSCDVLEKVVNYKFKNRFILQLALTHPSYRENFGTNPDHARNTLTNCGIRQPEYGDRRIHYMNTRKRGINTLINIMSRFGKKEETQSNITHNERLEFLGDAVVEFLTSIHLFHMFPDLEEGGLATYRAALVQNQHLAVLAKVLNLDQFMLYAHGSDLCHDLELRHAMANCFEAFMGALFLDGGIQVPDHVFSETMFKDQDVLLGVWKNYPPHPLQEQEPAGDRKWIKSFKLLQKLTEFEENIGVQFTHIRLLARAFTDRSIGYTNLTLGSNQRLEFLGDTVLQLIASEYLYKYFPEHHEGHLSLLRSSLVNNRTQAVVCDDLGMTNYAVYSHPKVELKTKDRADLLEAFLGALYVDKGLHHCLTFCNVCFFPRLQDFIMNQDWNDSKSKLQQCCLTLRTMDGGEPDIPVYKVVECKGPTNTRVYTVAVYFRGKRLAKASGHSIQMAEMNAAKQALENSEGLFPQLDHQKRVIAKSMKTHHWPLRPKSRTRTLRRETTSKSRDKKR